MINEVSINPFAKAHWSAQDKQHGKLVLQFIEKLMNEHDLAWIKAEYGQTDYVQHNRSLADGIDGVIAYFGKLTKQFPDFRYEVKNIMIDGDLVSVHSHATTHKKHRGNEQKGFNIVDNWRIRDGKLVEHWDAIQPLNGFMRFYYWLTGGATRNNNGLF